MIGPGPPSGIQDEKKEYKLTSDSVGNGDWVFVRYVLGFNVTLVPSGGAHGAFEITTDTEEDVKANNNVTAIRWPIGIVENTAADWFKGAATAIRTVQTKPGALKITTVGV